MLIDLAKRLLNGDLNVNSLTKSDKNIFIDNGYTASMKYKQFAWHIINGKDRPKCMKCGVKYTGWNGYSYRTYCSYECGAKCEINKIKKMNTNIKKYGASNPFQSLKIKNKIIETNVKRYGVKNPSQNKKIRDKIESTNLELYGSSYKHQAHLDDYAKKLYSNPDFLSEELTKYNSPTELAYLNGLNNSVLLKHIRKFDITYKKYHSSKYETKLIDIIKKYDVKIIQNTKKIIPPFEIDILIPELNLGFEVNGNYWHSTIINQSVNYHQDKFINSYKKGIFLYTIFEYEFDYVVNNIECIIEKNNNLIIEKFHTKNFDTLRIDLTKPIFSSNYALESISSPEKRKVKASKNSNVFLELYDCGYIIMDSNNG